MRNSLASYVAGRCSRSVVHFFLCFFMFFYVFFVLYFCGEQSEMMTTFVTNPQSNKWYISYRLGDQVSLALAPTEHPMQMQKVQMVEAPKPREQVVEDVVVAAAEGHTRRC